MLLVHGGLELWVGKNTQSSCLGVVCVVCSLSPSPFVLDAFKRVYSNEDIEKKAIPFLWENFDREGWSIWRADYKYEDELKRIFMSANLIGGMFQRLEKLHKYAFGSVLIFGEDYKSSISGIWVLRGQQLAFDVSASPTCVFACLSFIIVCSCICYVYKGHP